MRNRFSLLAILVIGGCSSLSPSDLLLPNGALPMTAPQAYRAWFGQTEACSGLDGQFEAIEWYVVPGVESFPNLVLMSNIIPQTPRVNRYLWKDIEMRVARRYGHRLTRPQC